MCNQRSLTKDHGYDDDDDDNYDDDDKSKIVKKNWSFWNLLQPPFQSDSKSDIFVMDIRILVKFYPC